jgi:hypothetical protein
MEEAAGWPGRGKKGDGRCNTPGAAGAAGPANTSEGIITSPNQMAGNITHQSVGSLLPADQSGIRITPPNQSARSIVSPNRRARRICQLTMMS